MSAPPLATLTDWREAFLSGAASARELCEQALARAEDARGRLGAVITVTDARARAAAAALDRAPERSALGPLAGVPVAVKDTICAAGDRTTAGSRMLASYVPPTDATAVARLERAGAIVVAKTNCDEFAMGSSTEHSAFGPARNPWDLTRTPGGSSGGSAAVVAARAVPVALGSDTGGSVRQPAGFCGCVGVRPSWGRVSRSGLVAFASSLDQIGPITLTVRDAATVLDVIAGPDPLDATAMREEPPGWSAALTGDIRGCRVGVPRHLLDAGVDPEVRAAVLAAVETLRRRGAVVVDVALAQARLAIPVYYLVATAEASSNLARYDGIRYGHRSAEAGALREVYERTRREGFGAEVTRRLILGTFVLSAGYRDAYYVKAQQVRRLIARDLDAALQAADVLVLPTSPTPAFALGEKTADPLAMYLSDVFTVGASLAGLPALSVPCGVSGAGLPVGLQVVGRRGDEATMLRVADAYERETGWWRQAPSGAWRHDRGGA